MLCSALAKDDNDDRLARAPRNSALFHVGTAMVGRHDVEAEMMGRRRRRAPLGSTVFVEGRAVWGVVVRCAMLMEEGRGKREERRMKLRCERGQPWKPRRQGSTVERYPRVPRGGGVERRRAVGKVLLKYIVI